MTHPNQKPTNPEGFELVHRSCVVRLGPQMCLLADNNHASLGVLSIASVDGCLQVVTDFDPATEICVTATANADATLAVKGVTAGASGGAAVTLFAISSSKSLKNPQGTVSYPAHTKLAPQSSIFDSTIDNLWINFLSIRRLETP